MTVEVRRVGSDDWEDMRHVRLRALREAPSAFASTAEREEAFSEETWRQRAARSDGVNVLAFAESRPIGIAGGFFEDAEPDVVHVVAMWVDPAYRGQGVGRRLVEEVLSWARERGAPAAKLWVTEGNHSAASLYARMGFAQTDERQPLPSNPQLHEVLMRRSLDDAGSTDVADPGQ